MSYKLFFCCGPHMTYLVMFSLLFALEQLKVSITKFKSQNNCVSVLLCLFFPVIPICLYSLRGLQCILNSFLCLSELKRVSCHSFKLSSCIIEMILLVCFFKNPIAEETPLVFLSTLPTFLPLRCFQSDLSRQSFDHVTFFFRIFHWLLITEWIKWKLLSKPFKVLNDLVPASSLDSLPATSVFKVLQRQ